MKSFKVVRGPFSGMSGEGRFIPESSTYLLFIPSFDDPKVTEYFHPSQVRPAEEEASAKRRPILVKKEFTTLRGQTDTVSIRGNKCSCGSVWCRNCFVTKGGSKRLADRLKLMDHKSVRQIVLTVDLKKFDGSGQKAYEHIRDKKALPQFIHNLRRTAGKKIKDYVWVLEWHEDGAPHWHLFVETVKGRKGMVGNEDILHYWSYGLAFESYIKSRKHWFRFTDYFGSRGYFNPKHGTEVKDKRHQVELPAWAKEVTYRIRKIGSQVTRKQAQSGKHQTKGQMEKDGKKKGAAPEKKYRTILEACGQATYCQIDMVFKGAVGRSFKKINIPYSCFREFKGEFIERSGYWVFMKMREFLLFIALYDNDIRLGSGEVATA